jgi:hypothetical protein
MLLFQGAENNMDVKGKKNKGKTDGRPTRSDLTLRLIPPAEDNLVFSPDGVPWKDYCKESPFLLLCLKRLVLSSKITPSRF